MDNPQIGALVRVKDDPDTIWDGYIGGVVPITARVRASRFVGVQFPGHPWQREGDVWYFDTRELEEVR